MRKHGVRILLDETPRLRAGGPAGRVYVLRYPDIARMADHVVPGKAVGSGFPMSALLVGTPARLLRCVLPTAN